MNFTIQRDILLQNLNNVSKALSTKVQMPGLTGIKFTVNKDFILLTASNSDISIQAVIKEKFVVIEGGEFVVQGKFLLEIVKKITSKDVDFVTFEENSVKVLAGKSVFTLNLLDIDTFPIISFNDSAINFTVDAINIKQLIRKTSFCISTSESRVVLTGVSLTTKENCLEVVATDSFRLARKRIFYEKELPSVKIVIPGKSLDELNKIVEESEEPVEIHCTSTKILFKYQNILFQSRLIEGVFPNTEALVPFNYVTQITFNKEELISAIDRVAIFVTNDISNIITMTISADGHIEFVSKSNEIGGAREEIVPTKVTNKVNMEISFSAKYFLDALRVFDSNEITLNLTGEIKPFIITAELDVNLIELILPVRG